MKLEASKRKVEDELQRYESNLEKERIINRKRKAKDKIENQKNIELIAKLTKNVHNLESEVKLLHKIDPMTGMDKVLNNSSRSNLNFRNNGRMSHKPSRNSKLKNSTNKKSLNHSQSNDTIFRLKCGSRTDQNRDISVTSKKSFNNLPQLNLSEITQGSPVSTYRMINPLSNSQKRTKLGTNTSTNMSLCNSVNGFFKNSVVVGEIGEGSGKYCAACKFKEWKKKHLSYNLDMFIENRDMIRYVICLGCNVQFEVKYFLDHVRSCRLSYNIPPMITKHSHSHKRLSKSPKNSLNNSKNSSIFKNSVAMSPKHE